MEGVQYVNSPADLSRQREEQIDNRHILRASTVYKAVGVSVGLLCIVQVALNVLFRLQAVGCSGGFHNVSTGNATITSDSDIRVLILERDQLVQERDQLVQERDQLVQERDQLAQEKVKLVQEKKKLVQEKVKLVQEKDQLVKEKEKLVQEKNQLVQERDQLVQEKVKLVQEKNQLVQDKVKLVQDKVKLVQEKNQLVQEKNQLVQDKVKLVQDKVKLVQEKNQLVQEKNQLVQEKEKLVQERDQLTMEKNELRAMNNRLREVNRMLDNKIFPQRHPTITINVGQNSPYCPPGWQLHMSSCYYRSSSISNWGFAIQDCAWKGSHLVILNDEDEERFVHGFGGAGQMWMGLRRYRDSTNAWVEGCSVNYQNWNDVQVNPEHWKNYQETCAFADQGSSFLKTWFWGSCWEQYYWVCEMELRSRYW